MVTKYNEKLLEEQEEVRRFLSEIAHQIRTPLTNMETYLDLLREQTLTKEAVSYTHLDVYKRQPP